MVKYAYDYSDKFMKKFKKLDNSFKIKTLKQIRKIIKNPQVGKTMKRNRKGTREVYVSPYRLAYLFNEYDSRIYFLDLYHKDQQ